MFKISNQGHQNVITSIQNTRARLRKFTTAMNLANFRPQIADASKRFHPLKDFYTPFTNRQKQVVLFQNHFLLSTKCPITKLQRPKLCFSSARGFQARQRQFTVSPITGAVVVTSNPRKDENGKEMLIDISSRASAVSQRYRLANFEFVLTSTSV